MIKILFITYNLILGGTSSTLYDLVRLLDKDKFQITIFTIHDGGAWEQKFRDAGVRVVHAYTGMENGKSLFQKIKNRIRLKRIAYARSHMGKGLIQLCLGESFDIAVLQHSYEPYERIAFLPGAKTVRYIHGDVQSNDRFRSVLQPSAPYFSRYDKIICVSKWAEDAFHQVFGCRDKTAVCHNPIDSDHIRKLADAPLEIDTGLPYICAVGRLAPEKGVERLVRIHKHLLDEGLAHRLVIVGEGPERPNIENAIRQTGTQDSVILAGYQANPYPYIKNSLFTVCPSYSEGLHMVSMESLCFGVPVVAAVGPVKELLGEEPCGIVTENDDASLEAGIRKMLADQAFYRQAKEAARRRSSAFTSEAMVRRVEEVFLSLVEKEKKQ